MRLAQVKNGIVVNVIEATVRPDWAVDWPEAAEAGPGWLWDGADFAPTPASAPDLVALRASAIARVNAAVGDVRKRFITQIPGQEMLYLRKEAEARAWLVDQEPDLARYPLIAAEIGITGENADQIAQIWVNMAAIWVDLAAPLETARLGAIAQIEAADSPEAIEIGMAGLIATLEAQSGDV